VASALTAEQAGSRFEPTTTIQLIIKATVAPGALIHTDEYGIYARLEGLEGWGYQHKTICRGRGCARWRVPRSKPG